LYLRTIRRGLHPTNRNYQLGFQYKPVLDFSPTSDEGTLAADRKAAKLCLLRVPPYVPLADRWEQELADLAELEREAEEAEASARRAEAAAEHGSLEEGDWFTHDSEPFDL
jgi:hypothetical protein